MLKAFSESGRYRGGASNSSSSVSVRGKIGCVVWTVGEWERERKKRDELEIVC